MLDRRGSRALAVRAWRVGAVALLAVGFVGCAGTRPKETSIPWTFSALLAPEPQLVEPREPNLAPDSSQVTPSTPKRIRKKPETVGSAATESGAVARDSLDSRADSVTAAPTDEDPLSVAIPEQEKMRLIRETDRELKDAHQALEPVRSGPLSPEDQEKLRVIENLIEESVRARESGKAADAASLAHKARLLADEFANR